LGARKENDLDVEPENSGRSVRRVKPGEIMVISLHEWGGTPGKCSPTAEQTRTDMPYYILHFPSVSMEHAVTYLTEALCCNPEVAGTIPDESIGLLT
jgi:hypothetical protein